MGYLKSFLIAVYQSLVLLIVCVFLISACQSTDEELAEEVQEVQEVSYANIESISKAPSKSINSLELSKIEIQDIGNPVGKGFSYILDNQLLFFDLARGEVLEIDPETGSQKVIITKGEGPNQVPRFESFTHSDDKRIFLDGYAFFIYDSNWEQIGRNSYDFYANDEMTEIEANPKGEMIGVYELKYWENQPHIVDDKLWINIESSNPKFNFLMNESYYRDSRIVGEVNLSTGEVERILGRRTPIYLNYRFIPHHDTFYLTPYGDDFLLSFEPDSAIYLVDKMLNPKSYFGAKGIGMNQAYFEVSDIDAWEASGKDALTKEGFYKHVYGSQEDNMIMRTYTLGNEASEILNIKDNPKRLQIFKNFQLIGDVEVPTYFKVIGKIGEYYYADGSGENPDNEEILIYRFKID